MKTLSNLFVTLLIIIFLTGFNACKKTETQVVFLPETNASICNKWDFTEILINDSIIPLNDSMKFPNGNPIIFNGQPMWVYDGDSLIFNSDNTYSSYVPDNHYHFPYIASFYPPDTVFKYIGTRHNGTWQYHLSLNNIEISESLYDMVPGIVQIKKLSEDTLWLKQPPLEYHFVKY